MYKDCHLHTTISHDGQSSVWEYIAAAHEKHVDEILLTEHYDDYTGSTRSCIHYLLMPMRRNTVVSEKKPIFPLASA